ncbi:hypothetical protein BC939DRAFT_473968 [Gamsiella multidivaricata]|uniref:uncharacterized protein n=1 Tax=Gamsiella multidivaricata TaxID=101098 RepID=UPI002220F5AB|nr:uncharacterized protein BC939DRAFT_473968 [Gamsiella multidivaricata]KAI7829767.1 hypothetical protein BC939DRAFT_473968 [Gamsiella multidivaricata]
MGKDTTDAGFAGYSQITDLILVPGDNLIQAVAAIDNTLPGGSELATELFYQNTTVTMYGFPGVSKNPALAAGLQSLVTQTVIPAGLETFQNAPPYSATWKIKVPPTAVDDGMIEITTTFSNPYFSLPLHMLLPVSDPAVYTGTDPSHIEVPMGNGGTPNRIFDFLNNFKFDLAPNSSTTITMQLQLSTIGMNGTPRSYVEGVVEQSKSGTVPIYVMLLPECTLGKDPRKFQGYWASDTIYPDLTFLTLETGPDFALILDWFDKKYPPMPLIATNPVSGVTSPTVSPSVVSPTSTVTAPTDPSSTTPSTTASAAPNPEPTPTTTTTTTTTVTPSPTPEVLNPV